MTAIVTSSLTKYYGSARGVVDLDLTVEPGEVFGFLGPNGAGKTTTIRLLLGLIKPTKGEAEIFGATASAQAPAVRGEIGYLSGEPGFCSHLRGGAFLARMASLRGQKLDAKGLQVAKRLDLDLSKKIKSMSHGTTQKLAITQALMHDAQLLILDEPTTGLDPLAQQTFYELLQEERERGRTVFLSSHLLGEVERICTRVGVVRDGRLVVVEDVAALKKKRVKWAEVKLSSRVDETVFNVPAIRSVERDGLRYRFSITGDYGEVLAALSACPIEDLTIRDATLEEIFLEYYRAPGEEGP